MIRSPPAAPGRCIASLLPCRRTRERTGAAHRFPPIRSASGCRSPRRAWPLHGGMVTRCRHRTPVWSCARDTVEDSPRECRWRRFLPLILLGIRRLLTSPLWSCRRRRPHEHSRRCPRLRLRAWEPLRRLDLANLQHVALLVRRDEQRPLVGVASLPRHVTVAQVVVGGPDVLEQAIVMFAVFGERR